MSKKFSDFPNAVNSSGMTPVGLQGGANVQMPPSALAKAIQDAIAQSVNFTFAGNLAAANLSGTNTGDETPATLIAKGAQIIYYGTASGTNTYAVTASPVATGYTTKLLAVVTFTNANTGASTLNLNGVGAAAIQLAGAALTPGQIAAGSTLELIYDGAVFQIVGGIASAITALTGVVSASGPGSAATSLNIDTLTAKTTPVDADEAAIADSAASNAAKKVTWANIKATLKTYFDTLYAATGSYITALTGDVTASGPGSAAATIANNAVTNAKLEQMAAHTLKVNITGSTANAVDSSLSAILDAEVGSAKGTFLVRGTSVWSPFPVGTNTQLIVADSTQTLGVKWADAPSAAGINKGLDKDRPAASAGTQIYVSQDAKITYTSDGTNWFTTFGPDKIYIGPFSTANFGQSQFTGANVGPVMTNPYTILVCFNIISLPGTTRNVLVSYGNGAGTTGWYVTTSSVNANKISLFLRGVNSSAETEFASMTALTTGAHALAISYDGSNYVLVLDGGSAVTVAATGTFTPAAAGDSCFLGKFANSSLPLANGGLSYVYGYASALSTGDKQTLTATPGNYFPGAISTAPAWVWTAKTAIYGSVSRTWGSAVNAAGTSNMVLTGSLAYVLP